MIDTRKELTVPSINLNFNFETECYGKHLRLSSQKTQVKSQIFEKKTTDMK